jgi:hypothetical protein
MRVWGDQTATQSTAIALPLQFNPGTVVLPASLALVPIDKGVDLDLRYLSPIPEFPADVLGKIKWAV